MRFAKISSKFKETLDGNKDQKNTPINNTKNFAALTLVHKRWMWRYQIYVLIHDKDYLFLLKYHLNES